MPPTTIPTLATTGDTEIFGLRLKLEPADWRLVDQATESSFQLEYSPASHPCEVGRCPMLLIYTDQFELYQLIVKHGELREPNECAVGASAFKPAEFQGYRSVGGEMAKYYINPWCPLFVQDAGVPRQRRNWLVPDRGILILAVQGFDASVIPDLDRILELATWT